MSREGQHIINRFNHWYVYVKSRIPLTSLTIDMYMSREGQDIINRLTIDMYMSREGKDIINRFNYGNLYIKRGLVSH